MVISSTGCREKYEPPVISSQNSLLVVEGNLNAGGGATNIRLTKTYKLEDTSRLIVENNALVTVEGKDNTIQVLSGNGDGYYISPGLNLITGNEYRLRIRTTNGREYLSDFIKAKTTPAIDSVNWERDQGGIHTYVNTHDASGNSRYYRWEYEETWEIRSYYFSQFVFDNGTVRPRVFPDEDVSVCWKTEKSSAILLASSVRLQDDVIFRQPLNLVPDKSEKIQVRYSILVKQYAIEKDAYNFYEVMKKNTEELGAFFSPLPTEARGNIHCVSNPDEDVIGYVTASAETEKRIFITIPQWGFFVPCESITVPKTADSINYYFGGGSYIPWADDFFPPVYYASIPQCVDCRSRGGTTIRPSFW